MQICASTHFEAQFDIACGVVARIGLQVHVVERVASDAVSAIASGCEHQSTRLLIEGPDCRILEPEMHLRRSAPRGNPQLRRKSQGIDPAPAGPRWPSWHPVVLCRAVPNMCRGSWCRYRGGLSSRPCGRATEFV